MRLTVPFDGRIRVTKNLRLFELGRVLVRLDHVASFIVNANHSAMRAAEELCVADRVVDSVRSAIFCRLSISRDGFLLPLNIDLDWCGQDSAGTVETSESK